MTKKWLSLLVTAPICAIVVLLGGYWILHADLDFGAPFPDPSEYELRQERALDMITRLGRGEDLSPDERTELVAFYEDMIDFRDELSNEVILFHGRRAIETLFDLRVSMVRDSSLSQARNTAMCLVRDFGDEYRPELRSVEEALVNQEQLVLRTAQAFIDQIGIYRRTLTETGRSVSEGCFLAPEDYYATARDLQDAEGLKRNVEPLLDLFTKSCRTEPEGVRVVVNKMLDIYPEAARTPPGQDVCEGVTN